MKFTKYLMAAVLAVLALGCSKEQVAVEGTPDGQEVTVTFTAGLPGTPATKAIGDGTTAKNLTVAVYEDANNAAGNHLNLDQTATFTDLKATVNFSLVKGKTYHFIFWAQATGAPYTFDKENKEIAVSYAGDANDESRDAFFAVKTVKVTGAMTEPVELHRPFAQVNFGTADFVAAQAAGVEPKTSVVVATDVATVFDPFKGEGKNPATVTGTASTEFTAAAIPTDPVTLTVEGKAYKYLAMNYIIPTGLIGEKHVTNLTATFTDAAGQNVEVSVPSAPVQANWRTNIVGNLLTDQVIFNVEIKPAFEDEENINVTNISTLNDLKTLFANGGSATLMADITVPESVVLKGQKTVNLNLGGKTITYSGTGNAMFRVEEGKLIIDSDGNLNGGGDDAKERVIIMAKGTDSHIIIKNGNFKMGKCTASEHDYYDCVYAMAGGKIDIYGGTFETEATRPNGKHYILNVNNDNPGVINVYGGKFIGYDPKTGDDVNLGTFVAAGYTSKKTGTNPDVYEVVPAPKAVVKTAAELKTMLTTLTSSGSGDNVVEITDDIIFADGETWTPVTVAGYTGAGVITVKGNGHTIKGLDNVLFAGGFAGKSGIAVYDLTLESSKINDSANGQGLGAFVGSIDSMEKIELVNCHLVNSEITSTGGARVGGLIGWTAGYNDPNNGPVSTYITVKNCSVENCQITAKGSVGAIIGHAGANPATYHTIEGNTVKDCTLHSTADGGWRVGVVVGTANVGEVTINGTIESGNTLIQDGKTAPAGQSNLYGRFVPGTTGKLTIDGVAVTL